MDHWWNQFLGELIRRRADSGNHLFKAVGVRSLDYAELRVIGLAMKHLTEASLWSVVGGYLLFRSYQGFRQPSVDSSWFTPYALLVVSGLAFFCAFGTYSQKRAGKSTQGTRIGEERLTRSEKITFKALALPAVLVGVVLLGLAGWLAWGQWVKVARWPRANAILISKDISSVGARLVFQYEAKGQMFTGLAFRFGSEKAVRNTLEAYEPGTVQKISYDPEDPTQVETILRYSLELFMGSIAAAVFGILFVAGGVVVYRWSYEFAAPLVNPSDPN